MCPNKKKKKKKRKRKIIAHMKLNYLPYCQHKSTFSHERLWRDILLSQEETCPWRNINDSIWNTFISTENLSTELKNVNNLRCWNKNEKLFDKEWKMTLNVVDLLPNMKLWSLVVAFSNIIWKILITIN